MRVQYLEVTGGQYILVLSEVPEGVVQFQEGRPVLAKEGFDGCAGVITTPEPAQVGPESVYEMQRREAAEGQRGVDKLLSDLKLPVGSIVPSDKLLADLAQVPVADGFCSCLPGEPAMQATCGIAAHRRLTGRR